MSTDYRRIELGACSWCGHKPHDGNACASSIRTRDSEAAPCACTKGAS